MIDIQANTLKESICASAQADNEEWSFIGLHTSNWGHPCISSKFIHKQIVKLTFVSYTIKKRIFTPNTESAVSSIM